MRHRSIGAVGPAPLSVPALQRCRGAVCRFEDNAGDMFLRRAR
jgi:hypothetical protein